MTNGNDILVNAPGAQTLDGGAGYDTVDYSAGGSVAVNISPYTILTGAHTLQPGTALDASGAVDRLLNIEKVITGAGHDSIYLTLGQDAETRDGVDNVLFKIEDSNHGLSTVSLGAGYDQLVIWAQGRTDAITMFANGGDADGSIGSIFLGQDQIDYAGVQNLVIFAGSGDDQLSGDSGGDYFRGGAGADTLYGANGDDLLIGGLGADFLIGGDGFDTVAYWATASGVSIRRVYGTGNVQGGNAQTGPAAGEALGDAYESIERFYLSQHSDSFIVQDQNAVVSEEVEDGGASGADTIDTGGGDDRVQLTLGGLETGAKVVDMGPGANDVLRLDALQSTANIKVSIGLQHANGMDGNIQIAGQARGAFYDVDMLEFVGGSGADTVTGGARSDKLYGNVGADQLNGAGGEDYLYGGDGADLLDGGESADVLIGEFGDDAYVVDSLADFVREEVGQGNDTVRTALGAYTLADNVETLVGLAANGQSLTGNGQDNTVRGGAGNDAINGGDGADVLEGGLGIDTLQGGAGSDTASWANAASAVTANMANGYGSTSASDLDFFSEVENLAGSAFNDLLVGNFGANKLSGGAGADTLVGGDGQDTLDGGEGVDIVSYAFAAGAVTVNLLTGVANVTGDGVEQVLNVETVFGGVWADELRGGTSANSLNGGDGDDRLFGDLGADTLQGGAGSDTLDGGAGVDTASYAEAAAGVTVSVTGAGQNTGGAGVDSLSGIENLEGSAFNDSLRGDGGNNSLNGGLGDDVLNGGLGADTLNGSNGRDTVLYNGLGVAAGVTVDLALTTAQNTGGAGTDTLIGVEDLVGTNFADVLRGSNGDNALKGGSGSDLLDGRNGRDTLAGQAGDDTLAGGEGADVLQGGTENDTLTGDAGNDKLAGDEGADVINGGLGADQLSGGAGVDRFVFTALTDSTVVLSGRDKILDFDVAGGDLIDLSAIDAVTGGTNQAFKFVTAFTGVAGQLTVQDKGAYNLVLADVNGDKIADFSIYVAGPDPLTAGDFVL